MSKIKTLSIDLETFSSVSLKDCGVYKYASSPDAELLLFGYSADGEPVRVIDVAQDEKIPDAILAALSDNDVIKWAYNASFERIFLSEWLRRNHPEYFRSYGTLEDTVGNYLDPSSWKCSMVWAAYMGLPLSLEGVGAVLKLEDQKLKEGKDLIRYFCVPCSPTKSNGGRTRNLPEHDTEKWTLFKKYNRRDVEVEMAIQKRLARFPVPDFVWEEYHIDQEINDRGILLDMDVVRNAIIFDEKSKSALMSAMQDITNLDNPNSVSQLKQWLSDQGVDFESLGKKEVAAFIKDSDGSNNRNITEALKLRLQLAKSSVKKYQAMKNCVCKDGRVHGMFLFYGANRSGRFSSRLIQIQNLPQNHLSDLKEAREFVRNGDYDTLSLLYDDIPDTLSQLIRTAFIARPGYKFIVSDYSAIEARVLAHLAGETWRSKVFADGGDIYCASASQMFHVPVVKNGINGELRQKGKQAELACIAEGEPVLTNRGLIPIEKVKQTDLLWDGESWVKHEGVIFKGEGEVITYEGLTATKDHLVWVEGKPQPIQFGIAASCGVHLLQTGDGGQAIRPGGDHQHKTRLYDIRNAGRHHRFTVSGKLVHNCGYGGSVGALKSMGAVEMGIPEEELQGLVDSWRRANPRIVQFWWDVDNAVKTTVKEHVTTDVREIKFFYKSGMLFIKLPSGRCLSYVKPRIGENRFGGESVTYEGVGATKKWERIESYGPKFVENIVQAVSRDILCNAMRTLRHCFIVGHVHDELIIECSRDVDVKTICEQMGRSPDWMPDIILRAEGYDTPFYLKC